MPIEKLIPKFLFDEEKIKQLKQIAPEAFADGKINWETLKENLGDYLEEDVQDAEHFGLFWPGKREARRLTVIPSQGALVPISGEGLDEEETQNIFIEGENLEVLKLLQKSYAGRIKMIYIDPPYNTGNDFVYEDDFTEPLQEYLRRTGQLDEEGKPFSTNTRADGRFHSKWLSMMYPRLRLARNLLRDDGVIFISIDDNEIHNLRSIMNEIFGEENSIGILVWEKKKKGAFLAGNLTNIKEYIVVFAKSNSSFLGLIGEIATEEETYPVIKTTNTRATRVIKKGIISKFKEKNHFVASGTRISAGNMEMILLSDMVIKNFILTSDVKVDSNWIYSQTLLDEYADKKELYVTQDLYFRRIVKEPRNKRLKDILFRVGEEDRAGAVYEPSENLYSDGWGTNEDGNAELHELLGIQNLFQFSKPSKLIAKLIYSLRKTDGIILDFFAGSGTTAQSVLEVNKHDNGKRKFILVQIPEKCDEESEAAKAGYEFITEITKKRIRNVSKRIKKEKGKTDVGFKIFRLMKSNFRTWKNYEGQSVEDLEKQFSLFASPLTDGWKSEDVLFEIFLLEGFPLDSEVQLQKEYKKNSVNLITSEFCKHKLLICLDKKLMPETVANLKIVDGDIFICLDSAITDQDKVRLADKGLIKTI
jgi:adenine-specific DNA-methyltransferase